MEASDLTPGGAALGAFNVFGLFYFEKLIHGREFSQIREQYYKTVRPMHLQFVEPSKRWADLIIPEGGNNRVALSVMLGKLLRFIEIGERP